MAAVLPSSRTAAPVPDERLYAEYGTLAVQTSSPECLSTTTSQFRTRSTLQYIILPWGDSRCQPHAVGTLPVNIDDCVSGKDK